jgi:peptide deformylase
MALRKIATIGNPVLREVAREITRQELATPAMQSFIDDLVETMRDANGAGLAANQIHEPIRICAIEQKKNPRYPEKPDFPLTILVNPIVEPLSDRTFLNYEGCLSVPDLRGEAERFLEIRVRAWDRHGDDWVREIRGLTAGTFQHELDHLDGKLYLDRVKDTRSLCSLKEFERWHLADFAARARELIAKWGA